MSRYLGPAWECETCKGIVWQEKPWDCPVCGKDTCSHCFDRFAICRQCGYGKTDIELKNIHDQHYGVEGE